MTIVYGCDRIVLVFHGKLPKLCLVLPQNFMFLQVVLNFHGLMTSKFEVKSHNLLFHQGSFMNPSELTYASCYTNNLRTYPSLVLDLKPLHLVDAMIMMM